MKKAIFLLVVFLSINRLFAQQLTLKIGEIFTIETSYTVKSKFNINEQYTFQYKVLSGNNAAYKLQCTLLKAKNESKFSNSSIKLNTDSIRKTVFTSISLLTPFILLQKPFTVIFSPKNNLISIEGTDELIKQAITRWHITASTQKNIKPNLDAFLSAAIKSMFFELPEKKITYRSVWTDEEKVNYEVIAIRGALLDITAVAADKTMHARYTLNEVTGLLEDANIAGQYNTNKGPELNNYLQKMVRNTTAVADTAWLNMAITMSTMSDAINKDTALNYFKTYDDLYKSDAYYLARKQYLKQKLKIYN